MEEIEYIGKCLLVNENGKKILVIGDLHLGYEEALNKTGVFVSRKMFEEMIAEFDKIFAKSGNVDEIVLLGDVKHVFGDVLKQERNDSIILLNYLLEKSKKIIITKGNHDVIIEPILVGKNNIELVDYYIHGEYAFIHGNRDYDEVWSEEIKTIIIGHVHPAVKLKEGEKVEKYKCFLIGKIKNGLKIKELIVVPSFSEYNEGSDIREDYVKLPWNVNFDKFEVKIVDEDTLKVLDFGKLGKIDNN